MFRKLLVASMLTLSLSACAPAEALNARGQDLSL